MCTPLHRNSTRLSLASWAARQQAAGSQSRAGMAAMPAAAAAEESDGDPPGEGDQGGVDQNDVPAPLPESTIVLLRYMQGMHDEDSTSSSDESDQDEDEVATHCDNTAS